MGRRPCASDARLGLLRPQVVTSSLVDGHASTRVKSSQAVSSARLKSFLFFIFLLLFVFFLPTCRSYA